MGPWAHGPLGPGPWARAHAQDPIFQVNVAELLNHYACPKNMASWNSPPDPVFSADPSEMQSSGAGHTLGSTRLGGQDDGSLHKLPQTKACHFLSTSY